METPASDTEEDCIACVAGTYSTTVASTASSDCIACAAGTYSSTVASASDGDCIACLVGKYVDVAGSNDVTDCIDCIAGKYIDVTGSDESSDCIDCIAGKYVDTAGHDEASDCIDCAAGKYVDVPGSDEATDCVDCTAGQYVGGAGSDDASDCINCPEHSGTVAATGSTQPSACLCDAGYTGTIAVGSDTCTACGANEYKTSSGTPACTACPSNSLATDASAATDASVCLCNEGHSGAITQESDVCTACPPGEYKAVTGTSECIECSGGSMTDTLEASGAVSCRGCAAGRFSDISIEPCMCRDSGVACRWTKLSDVPLEKGFVFGHSTVALANGDGDETLLLFGGVSGSMHTELLEYKYLAGSWASFSTTGASPSVRQSHSATEIMVTSIDRAMAIFGGDGGVSGTDPLSDLWLFSSPAKRWQQLTDEDGTWPAGRWGHSAVAVAGPDHTQSLVIFGGMGTAGILSDAWEFSFVTMIWSSLTVSGSPPAARYLHTVVQLGSKMFMYGGMTKFGHSKELWQLDLSAGGATGVWTPLTPFSAQPLPELYGAAAVPMLTLGGDEGFLLFGGNAGYGLASSSAWHYDVTVNCLAEVAAVDGGDGVPTARFQHGAAGVAAGNAVTVIGGRSFGVQDKKDTWQCAVELADTGR